MNSQRAATFAACVLTASLLASCSAAVSVHLAQPSTSPAAVLASDDLQSSPAPDANPTSSAEALKTASTVMKAYDEWSLSSDDWLGGLNPYLTQEASAELNGTDPDLISHDLSIESVMLDPGSSAAGAVAVVTTDHGQFRVLLVQEADRWLVAHITTPDAAQ